MESVKDTLSHQERMASDRMIEEPHWRQLAKLLRPDDTDFDDLSSERERDDSELFDSTGLYGIDDLVGGLFSQATNPASRWFEVTVGDPDLARWEPVKDALMQTTSIMYASLAPAISTFYENAPAWFADMAAFGPGFLAQEEATGRERLIDAAIPLAQMYKAIDGDGETSRLHRKYVLSGRQIKQKWQVPDENAVKDDRKYTIVHAVYPNPDYRSGAFGPRGMRYVSCRVCEEIKGWKAEAFVQEMPFHEIGWFRRAGRIWARGPGHNTRADNNMLQEIERTNLVGAQFDAEPMLLALDDTDITAADLAPNAILAGAMGENAKPNLQYLERKSRTQLAEAKAEQKRQAITRAFKFGIQQVANRPQMTAFEFAGWQAQELRLMAPNLIQVQRGLAGFLSRRYGLLARARQLPPMPPEVARAGLGVEFISPLAKAQKLATAQSNMQFFASLDQQFAATGDASVYDVADRDKSNLQIGEAMLEDKSIMNSPDRIQKIREARAAAQAQQQELANAGAAAEVLATAAHAAQAGSLAKKRQA